jgi:DNA-directed RNA polymerase specialized sigma subunit
MAPEGRLPRRPIFLFVPKPNDSWDGSEAVPPIKANIGENALAKRMAELPDLQKKVLAMYYYENMQLSQIAAVFGLGESRICQIRGEAVEVLRKYFTRLLA